jgi:hypothetical protein
MGVVLQPGLEDAFAAAVEVVAVDEGELGWGVGGHGVADYCMNSQYIGATFCLDVGLGNGWGAGRFIAKTS